MPSMLPITHYFLFPFKDGVGMLSLRDLPNIESVLGRNIQSSWYKRCIVQESLYMRIRRLLNCSYCCGETKKKKKKRKKESETRKAQAIDQLLNSSSRNL